MKDLITTDKKQTARTSLITQAQPKQTGDKPVTKMLRLTKYGPKKFIDKVIGAISAITDDDAKNKLDTIMKAIKDGDIEKAKTNINDVVLNIPNFPSVIRQFLYTFMAAEDFGTGDEKDKYKSLSVLIRKLNKLLGNIPDDMKFENLRTQIQDIMAAEIKSIVKTDQQQFKQEEFKRTLVQKQKEIDFNTKPTLKSLVDIINERAAANADSTKYKKFQQLLRKYNITDVSTINAIKQQLKKDNDNTVKSVNDMVESTTTDLSISNLLELLKKIPDAAVNVPELKKLRTKIQQQATKTKSIVEANLNKLLEFYGLDEEKDKVFIDNMIKQLNTPGIQGLKTLFQTKDTKDTDILELLKLLNEIPASVTSTPNLKDLATMSKDKKVLKYRFTKKKIGKSTSKPVLGISTDTYNIQKNLQTNYQKIKAALGDEDFIKFLSLYQGAKTDDERRSILKMMIDLSTDEKKKIDDKDFSSDLLKAVGTLVTPQHLTSLRLNKLTKTR